MSAITKIEWTDSTFNWWEGCTKVGPGCDNCYAESRNARFGGGRAVNWGPGAPRRLTSEHNRNNLRRWNNRPFYECRCCGWRGDEHDKEFRTPRNGCIHDLMPTRRRVFCSSLSDVFDNEVPQEWRDALFAEMEACTRLDFLVLTKRIGNVRKMVPASWLEPGGWPAHIRTGATIVDDPETRRDIHKLLALPCPNFLSMEPLRGPVDLVPYIHPDVGSTIDWVIVGGESGPNARPMHPDWVRSLRDQCAAAGVPFLFKQWGEWAEFEPDSPTIQVDPATAQGKALAARCDAFLSVDGHCVGAIGKTVQGVGYRGMSRVGKRQAGRLLDGRTHNGFPS